MKLELILVPFLVITVLGRKGFGPTDQEWGYVEVRDGAQMFWWLHYNTATTKYTERPLIIWLQGGPGGSSTQYGNFNELGPIDSNLNPRSTSWVNYVNVLFVDNPVGTGFSYVATQDLIPTNNSQIAEDFVNLLRGFYKDLPQFEKVPLYIFSESYGGKMAAEIALLLDQAVKAKTIKSNIKGVGLGDSWISPVDSCLTWLPYLYNLGVIDTVLYNQLNEQALDVKRFTEEGKWPGATIAFEQLQYAIDMYAGHIDFYNVLKKIQGEADISSSLSKEKSASKDNDEEIMLKVKEALNISSIWGANDSMVFDSLREDFMKPVTDIVEKLLNETDITVAVYNGQLDVIVDTPGTINWVDRLKYRGSDDWQKAKRTAFSVAGIYEGYQKRAGNLVFYWVNRAGHMVPADNPDGMYYILKEVTNNFKV